MKTLYIDCFSGVSGDMFLAALVDLGVPLDGIMKELQKLPIHFTIRSSQVQRGGITGTLLEVIDHESTQRHRHASDVIALVENSSLPQDVKENTMASLRALARAEGIIHGREPESVHFHELSGVDTVIDVAGTFLALKYLGTESVVCSPVPTGYGTVQTSHGILPLPAPATIELLRGIPLYAGSTEAELTTPTGAALVKSCCHRFGPIPRMRVESIGYGAGSRDLPTANVLRILWGNEESQHVLYGNDVVLETNIDDMTPQVFEYLNERLFEEGALDVFTTPVLMKKQRPGVLLTVISPQEKSMRLEEIIFIETTTLGIRSYEVKKKYLPRTIEQVNTHWGPIRVKRSLTPRGFRFTPEYDDCLELARKKHIPLQEIMSEAHRIAKKTAGENPPRDSIQ